MIYYLEDDDHLRLDYDKIYAYIDENLDVDTIDLRDCLSSESYYRTDLHYRQEYLDLVVNRIAEHYDVEIEEHKNNTTENADQKEDIII